MLCFQIDDREGRRFATAVRYESLRSLGLTIFLSLSVRRETGKELAVQVRCDEGIANHIDPESCVAHREVRGEALINI
jgi:hypothetical protein